MSELQIQLGKKALLSGKTLLLRPFLAVHFGVAQALLTTQVMFLSKQIVHQGVNLNAARISYTRLQKHLPFFSRRWIIATVRSMEKKGVLEVIRTGRVNILAANGQADVGEEHPSPSAGAIMLVFPALACAVGLHEAIILQQIHIRCCEYDGSMWAIASFRRWHSDILPFFSIATIKRLISKLREAGLIHVTDYHSEDGVVNRYRVNYLNLAKVLGVPVPAVEAPPAEWNSDDWINPLYPIKLSCQKQKFGAMESFVH